MKILHYCQHVLGIGHFHRSLEICRACSRDHQLTMVVGGPEIALGAEPFSFFKLPGLQMDETFSGLMSCDPKRDLAQVKEERVKKLLEFFKDYRPDCLIVELYPFGRKAFRFELDPLLAAAQESRAKIVCSLRDILVEKKQDRRLHEKRAVDTLNQFFDALLVHADPTVVRLDSTFELVNEIRVPLHYTGFITPQPSAGARERIRASIGLEDDRKLIVASIGSGSVGSRLLKGAVRALPFISAAENIHLRLFTGPYCDQSTFDQLAANCDDSLSVERFSDRFSDWLAAADLSVSMAGYNTSMNVLAAGVPALM
ncbi:MAG: glycosyltransferase, partial [Desulfofustis sp.]